jgi:hypothetical protein
MKEALRSSQTSVLTRATRGNIPEDAILRLHFMLIPRPVWGGGIVCKNVVIIGISTTGTATSDSVSVVDGLEQAACGRITALVTTRR